MKNSYNIAAIFILTIFSFSPVRAGIFTDVTDNYFDTPVYADNITLIDYNNDGFPDLLIGGPDGPVLFKNINGNKFKKVSISYNNNVVNGIFADCDADGDLDMFVTGGFSAGSRLLINIDGKGDFVPLKSEALDKIGEAVAAAWIDYNRDGLPDLAVGGFGTLEDVENGTCSKEKIFKNMGSCTFVEVDMEMEDTDGCTRSVTWLPHEEIIKSSSEQEGKRGFLAAVRDTKLDDNKNFKDLLLEAEDDETFSDRSSGRNFEGDFSYSDIYGGRGNGGDFFIYGDRLCFIKLNIIPDSWSIEDGYDRSRLLCWKDPKADDFSYEDFWEDSGLPVLSVNDEFSLWIAAEFLDYNLDGVPDLYLVAREPFFETETASSWHGTLFKGEEDTDNKVHFTEVGGEINTWHGTDVVSGDIDNDGDPDLIIAARRNYLGVNNIQPRVLIYRNDTATTKKWLKILPVSLSETFTLYGSVVEVACADKIYRRIIGGRFGRHGSQNPAEVIVGLGNCQNNTVSVTLIPRDISHTSVTYDNVPVNETFRPVYEGEVHIYRGVMKNGECKGTPPPHPVHPSVNQWPFIDEGAAGDEDSYCYKVYVDSTQKWLNIGVIKSGEDLIIIHRSSSSQLKRGDEPQNIKEVLADQFRKCITIEDSAAASFYKADYKDIEVSKIDGSTIKICPK